MQEYEVFFFETGYHKHHQTWTPIVGDDQQFQMEPDNAVYKYAVAVMNIELWGLDKREKREIFKNCVLISFKKTTLWPLFMDGVQLPQG